MDKDSTGFISVMELWHILTSIGEKLEPAEFDEWIGEVDVGSDGKIHYEDFIARMVANMSMTGESLPIVASQSSSVQHFWAATLAYKAEASDLQRQLRHLQSQLDMLSSHASTLTQGRRARVGATSIVNGHLTLA